LECLHPRAGRGNASRARPACSKRSFRIAGITDLAAKPGERREIVVAREGNFVEFIVNLGRADRWAAYDRRLEFIGQDYGSRAQAATACRHKTHGEKKLPIGDILACTPQ
jgi:hypothetical protein